MTTSTYNVLKIFQKGILIIIIHFTYHQNNWFRRTFWTSKLRDHLCTRTSNLSYILLFQTIYYRRKTPCSQIDDVHGLELDILTPTSKLPLLLNLACLRILNDLVKEYFLIILNNIHNSKEVYKCLPIITSYLSL